MSSSDDTLEMVVILDTAQARELGVVGQEAPVVGMAEDEESGERWLGVYLTDLLVVSFPERDVRHTGRSVPRTDVYNGDSIRVSQRGIPLEDED